MKAARGTSLARQQIRYSEFDCYEWLRTQAPCRWREHTRLTFVEVQLRMLESAGSLRDPDLVTKWQKRIEFGRPIPPLIVSHTGHDTYYVHDGNHRLDALRAMFPNQKIAIRVACLQPIRGYCFRFRRLGNYGTYILEPQKPQPRSVHKEPVTGDLSLLSGRTMVLTAHPDDEMACAGLLQRIREPMVFFATEGAPRTKFFWDRYGSQAVYGRVRRAEANAALAAIDVGLRGFIGDWVAGGNDLTDQQVFRFLPLAFDAAVRAVRSFEPEALLVPAYEGGHPDHDACSFLGSLLGRYFDLPVWEMPLYHRGDSGMIICRRFRRVNGTEYFLTLTTSELRLREYMMGSYASQWDLTDFVNTPLETYRPQSRYDYLRPPHSGPLNYQLWQWQINPLEVCDRFREALSLIDGEPAGGRPPAQNPTVLQLL